MHAITHRKSNLLIASIRSLASSPSSTHASRAAMPRAKSFCGSLKLYTTANAMMVEK